MSKTRGYTASSREIYLWGAGGIANTLLISIWGQGSNILTTGFGISPIIVGWAAMAPRLLDSILDPIMGHLSDNTHTRWGRRKPYLVIGALLGAIFMAGMWWVGPTWSERTQLAYILTVGTIFYVFWGLYSMAYSALGFELTDDYHVRSKIGAVANLSTNIAWVAAAWIYWLALRPIFGNAVAGMRWVAGALGVVVLISALATVLGCRERFTQSNRKHVNIFKAIRQTLRNRPFAMLISMTLVSQLGGAAGSAMFFVKVYYVCAGDRALALKIGGIGTVIGVVYGFILMPMIPWASQTLGKRLGLILGNALGLFGAILNVVILTPRYPYLQLLPVILLVPISTVCGILAGAIYPDICDIDELEHGERREGLYNAVTTFVSKMGNSLLALVGAYMVSFAGYNAKLPMQTAETLLRLRWLAYAPAIGVAILTLAIAVRFPVTEQMMAVVRGQLEARRAAAQSSGSSVAALDEVVAV